MTNSSMPIVCCRTERETYDADAAIRYAARELARLERVRRAMWLLAREGCMEDDRAEAINFACDSEAAEVKRQLTQTLTDARTI